MKAHKFMIASIILLASFTLLSACSTTNKQTQTAPTKANTTQNSKMAIGEYIENSTKPILFFEVSEIDKEANTQSIYLFQSCKIKKYSLSIPLGELAKLDVEETIELLDNKQSQRLQKTYESNLKILESEEPINETDRQTLATSITELKEFKSTIDSFELKFFPYEINLTTDSSGNTTSAEKFEFKSEQMRINAMAYIESELGAQTRTTNFEITSYSGTYQIYDTSFATFNTTYMRSPAYIITPIKNEISFTLDHPDTKLKNVKME